MPGGLKDTIKDPVNDPDGYTGFLFSNADIGAAEWAMRRTLDYYQNQKNWRDIQKRGMVQDFSWKTSAKKYLNLYKSLLSTG
jgi:starch synthase